MGDENNLAMLRHLTDRLPPFPEASVEEPGFKIHEVPCGTSLSWDLMTVPEIISVARWFNSYSTEFPVHAHDAREWIIVYQGSMYITIEGEEKKRLLVGQSVVIDPGVKHFARFPEDCWCLAITIPQSKDWPVK